MLVKDLLYTCATAFIAKGRGLLASLFDAAGDIASVVTYGVGGVVAIRDGFAWYTLAVFAAMTAGSIGGTWSGVHLAAWLERRTGLPVAHASRGISARQT